MYCKHCGKELPLPDSDICTSCGKFVDKTKEKQIHLEHIRGPSKAWYLVPIFFGIIGGLVMYLVLKDEDRKMAKKGLVLGIIISAVATALVMIIYGVLFSLALSHFHNLPNNKIIPYKQPTSNLFFPGVVKFYNVIGGSGVVDNRVFKQIPSTLPSEWSADFDYKFTASSMPRSWIFVLSNTSADPATQDSSNIIMVEHGFNADQLMIERSWTGPNSNSSAGIPISPYAQYYVRINKSPTQLELSVFSDPARTINVAGSPVFLPISPTDYDGNLNFIQHDGCTPCGPGRTLTAEIDDTRIYGEKGGLKQIIFDDDYSSNAGWTQIGSSIAVNGTFAEQILPPLCDLPGGCNSPQKQELAYFPGVVRFNNAADGGGVDQNRVFKSLPSTLPLDNWIAYFDYNFTSSSIPAAYPLALTSTSADPEQQGPAGDAILVYHGDNSDVLHIRVHIGSEIIDAPGQYTGISISPNTPYFVKLERTPTQLELSVFSDSARTIQVPGSPVTLTILQNDFPNLNFVQHSTSLSSGSARTLSATVDNLQIYIKEANDNNELLFHDEYSSSTGWTKIGSSVAVDGTFSEQRVPQSCDLPGECNPLQKQGYLPGVVNFNVAGGGGMDENRVIKRLPSTLFENQWTADFDYKFTSSNIPAFIVLALSSSQVDPQSQKNSNQIIIEHGNGINAMFVEAYPMGTDSNGISISPNTQYYVRLEKTPDLLTLHLFSDQNRTVELPGSPVTLDISGTDYNNLNFIQHDGCRDCGTSRTLTAELDNMNITVIDLLGHRLPYFNDDYSSNAGWTQIGSSIAVTGSNVEQIPQMSHGNLSP